MPNYDWSREPAKYAAALAGWTHDPVTPKAPTNFEAVLNGDSAVDLSWDANPTNAGYLLSYTTDEWETQTDIDIDEDEVSYTLEDLIDDETYIFSLGTKTVDFLPEGEVIVGKRAYATIRDLISAVDDLTAVVDSTTQITLSWTGIAGNNGYLLQRTINGTTWVDTAIAVDAETKVVTGLVANTEYTFRIFTKREGDTELSLTSNEEIATTKIAAPVLTLGAVTDTSVVVNWTNITGNDGYTLFISDDAGETWDAGTDVAANIVTKTFDTLSDNTAYVFKAVTKRVDEPTTSADSNELDALTLISAPVLTLGTVTDDSITVEWTNVVGNDGYTIYISDDDGATWDSGTALNADVVTKTFTTLDSNSAYVFKATTERVATPTTSPESAELDGLTLISAPVGFAASNPTSSQITLSWTNVVGNDGYRVYKSTDNNTWEALIADIAADAVTTDVTGLTAETLYYFIIRTKRVAEPFFSEDSLTVQETTTA